MEDGLTVNDSKSVKMGASSNPNAARLATLQDKRKTLEETIASRNKELRQLCLKEAELTGIMPLEMPLEPGESPPSFRRRIGTAYQLPQNLINNINNEEESIASLELLMQIQANMAEAALGLASETHSSKTLRRQHMSQYNHHRQQFNILEEKLTFFKTRMQMSQQPSSPNFHHQQKQKKKPRPSEQDDTVSMNINMNDSFGKTVLRHSVRSLQHPLVTNESNEQRFSSHPKLTYRNSDNNLHTENAPHLRPEDALVSNFYRLNLNKNIIDRREVNTENIHIPNQYVQSHSNPNLYPQPGMQYSPTSHTLPQRSSQIISPCLSYDMNLHNDIQPSQTLHDYHHYNNNLHINVHGLLQRQSSPSTSSNSSSHRTQYYSPHNIHSQPSYQYYNTDQPQLLTSNPHQIQPHQQYEHDVMTSGLGGFWKRSESGEMVWCNSTNVDNVWQRDKRCGSLDRRKNKRLHKRMSPNVDPKSSTISSLPLYTDPVRNVPAKILQNVGRNRQDNRQLVRTQSLGSVGVQTIDSVWPSDDNSSCGSDTHSFNELNTVARKQKQKEWYETSLDDPPIPTTPRMPRSHSTLPSISPEEKYMDQSSSINLPSPQISKSILEIPAESNPTPKITEAGIELLNNNIPKNCTIVQAGHCKPYHEETKPFEMSDFYKYSTKFKKTPTKPQELRDRKPRQLMSPQTTAQQSLSDNFEDDNLSVIQKGIYQPLQPMKCQPFSPIINSNVSAGSIGSPSLNASLDLSQLTSNVAENFSAEMNAWYQNHEHQIDGDNGNRQTPRARSTATLV